MSFHFLSNCLRQHPNTFESLTFSSCARESSRYVQHFQSLLLVEGPALSPWYLGRRENGCFRAKHNHHLNVWSCQFKSAMLFCVDSRGWSRSSPYRLIALLSALKGKVKYAKNVFLHTVPRCLVFIFYCISKNISRYFIIRISEINYSPRFRCAPGKNLRLHSRVN